MLTIDLSGVSGVGSTTGAKYVISGPELRTRRRRLALARVRLPVQEHQSATAATARTGVASFVLDFDLNTGAVTGASGSVVTPNFPR